MLLALHSLHAAAAPAVPTIAEVDMALIEFTDTAPMVRLTLHNFTFAAKHAYQHPLTASGTLNQHWEATLLKDVLLRNAPDDALMVDAGMNLGFYSLLARSHGLKTLSIDIQQTLMQYFVASLDRSGYSRSRSRLVQAAISDRTLRNCFELHAHAKHQQAFARLKVEGVAHEDGRAGSSCSRLDDLVSQLYGAAQHVYLMKIDVEGQESRALRGAYGLLRGRRVEYVFIEIGDGAMDARFLPTNASKTMTRWEHANTSRDEVVDTLQTISSWGYVLYIIVQCSAPHSRYVLPNSTMFWTPLAGWPRMFVTVDKRIWPSTPHDILSTPRNAQSSSWAGGMTMPCAGTAISRRPPAVELIEVLDIPALVNGPLHLVDWNLFFARSDAKPPHTAAPRGQTSSVRTADRGAGGEAMTRIEKLEAEVSALKQSVDMLSKRVGV